MKIKDIISESPRAEQFQRQHAAISKRFASGDGNTIESTLATIIHSIESFTPPGSVGPYIVRNFKEPILIGLAKTSPFAALRVANTLRIHQIVWPELDRIIEKAIPALLTSRQHSVRDLTKMLRWLQGLFGKLDTNSDVKEFFETNKVQIIKMMLSFMKAGLGSAGVSAKITMLNLLQVLKSIGIDWPELTAFEQSSKSIAHIDESDSDNFDQAVRHARNMISQGELFWFINNLTQDNATPEQKVALLDALKKDIVGWLKTRRRNYLENTLRQIKEVRSLGVNWVELDQLVQEIANEFAAKIPSMGNLGQVIRICNHFADVNADLTVFKEYFEKNKVHIISTLLHSMKLYGDDALQMTHNIVNGIHAMGITWPELGIINKSLKSELRGPDED